MLLEKYQVKDGTGLVKYRELVNSLDTVFSDACNPTDVIQNARTTAVSYKISHLITIQKIGLKR